MSPREACSGPAEREFRFVHPARRAAAGCVSAFAVAAFAAHVFGPAADARVAAMVGADAEPSVAAASESSVVVAMRVAPAKH